MATYTFQDVFQYADAAVSKYVTDGAAAVAGSIQSVTYTLLAIYVVLWGWSMIRGMISEPVTEGAGRIVKIAIITSLATSSALYSSHVSNFLYEWPTAFAGVFQGGIVQNSAQLLDQMLDKGNMLGGQAWEKANLANMGNYLLAGIIFLITWIVTAISAVIIISSKLGLALLLAIGPVFILMMLFDATRQFFDKWLGMVVTAGFTIVLVTMAAALMFKIMDAAYDAAQLQANANAGIASMKAITPLVIYGVIGVFFILGTPHLAAGIGGGISTASAAAGGWAYNKISGATPSPLRMGKAGYQAGKSAYGKLRGAAGQFGKSEGGSIRGGRSGSPMAAYRKVTSRRASRAA